MNRHILLVITLLVLFTSCAKTKMGPKEVCFTFSKQQVKINDTLFIFNCSKNYNKQIWFLPDGSTQTTRHAFYHCTALGKFPVYLRIGNIPLTDTTGKMQEFEVIP